MPALRPFSGITPHLGERVFIDPACTVIGDVHIGEDSSIWPGTIIRGDVNHIRIGARTNIQDGSIINIKQLINFLWKRLISPHQDLILKNLTISIVNT